MRYLFATLISMCLLAFVLGCSGKHEQKTGLLSDSVCIENSTSSDIQTYNMYFLGHYIRCSEDSLYSEMEHLYTNEPDVLFDKETGNIDICGTLFHVNPNRDVLILMSSVQPKSKEMKKVRKYISKFHGEENYEDPDRYSWIQYTDSTLTGRNYPRILLRRIHTDEGGTVIFIQ